MYKLTYTSYTSGRVETKTIPAESETIARAYFFSFINGRFISCEEVK
ncbi:MAG: hypothetical protein WA061_02125 [Microgenomates group bacterium]